MQPNFLREAAAPKSDQLNADDLIGGIEKAIKITRVHDSGGSDQRVSIFFEGDNSKPWKPCKSMIRVLLNCWGDNAEMYIGRVILLIRDNSVTWGGAEVGGIRIKALSHIKDRMRFKLTKTRNNKVPYTVDKLDIAEKPTASPELIQKCKDAARKGAAAYAVFWPTLSSDEKVSLRPYREEFKAIIEKGEHDAQMEEGLNPVHSEEGAQPTQDIAVDAAAQSDADYAAYAAEEAE